MHLSVSMTLVLVYLLATLAAMGFSLRRSMKKTIYSYTNIGLIGGILFNTVFLIVTLHFLLTLPTVGGGGLRYAYETILTFPVTFSYYAAFVIIFISFLLGISNIALIRHEGFCLNNALSLLVAGLYVGGTVAVYLVSALLSRYVFRPFGANPVIGVLRTALPLFMLLMLCYFECILAGSAILGWIAARRIPAYDKDYIIVLGCSIDKRGGLLPLLRGRVNRAIRFAWDQEISTGKALKYVPSGGQGANEIMSEGSAMAFYLMTHGAEEYEVLPEKKSRNTWENLCFSKKIIEEITPNPKVAFATTNYHILRSGILANKAGLDAEGIAGDTKWYFWPNGFIREFFGILALEMKSHVYVACVMAVVCTIVGYWEHLWMGM